MHLYAYLSKIIVIFSENNFLNFFICINIVYS